jgi:DNA-binding beta-propeller fold protein YncE
MPAEPAARRVSAGLRILIAVSALFWTGAPIDSQPAPPPGSVMTVPLEPRVGFGREGSGPGEFLGPFGITVGPDGLLYVADDLSHRIQIFDRAGRLQRSFGRHGTAPGELAWVDSLAVEANGDLYVADTGNNRVQVWDRSGRFLRQFAGTRWLPWQRLRTPRHIRIGPDGLVYVADFHASVIRVYSKDGSAVRVIGRSGTGAGGLLGPLGMDFDAAGHLYVADSRNHRVQIFRPDGVFVRAFGAEGEGPGQFKAPHAVVVLPGDRLLIVDHANDRAQIVDLTGRPLAILGVGSGTSGLRRPTSAALAPDDVVYVVDQGNHRVVGWKVNAIGAQLRESSK